MSLLRESKKATPDTPTSPESSPAASPEKTFETVQDILAAGRAQVGTPDVEAAQAWLRAGIPAAEADITRHEAWRKAPVVPTPGVDDFPRYETVDDLLAAATAQNLRAPELRLCPLVDDFAAALACARGHVEAIAGARAVIERIPTLTPKDCQRDEHFRRAHRWPPSHLVEKLRNGLGSVSVGDDRLGDDARRLAAALTRLLAWAKGHAADAQPAMAIPRHNDAPEVSPTVTRFNVFGRQ